MSLSSGLDPSSAQQLDELICALRLEFTMTIVMITHDLDSIKDTTDRFLMLKDGKIEFLGNLSELAQNAHTLDSSNIFFSKQGERLWREM